MIDSILIIVGHLSFQGSKVKKYRGKSGKTLLLCSQRSQSSFKKTGLLVNLVLITTQMI